MTAHRFKIRVFAKMHDRADVSVAIFSNPDPAQLGFCQECAESFRSLCKVTRRDPMLRYRLEPSSGGPRRSGEIGRRTSLRG
jgi:hypothetical protein